MNSDAQIGTTLRDYICNPEGIPRPLCRFKSKVPLNEQGMSQYELDHAYLHGDRLILFPAPDFSSEHEKAAIEIPLSRHLDDKLVAVFARIK